MFCFIFKFFVTIVMNKQRLPVTVTNSDAKPLQGILMSLGSWL